MAKSLRTFLDDLQRLRPGEVVHVTRPVNPARHDVSAIVTQLADRKQFPVLLFEHPRNLHGNPSEVRLVMNCEVSKGKFQTALGVPPETDRAELALECLKREANPIPPVVVEPERGAGQGSHPARRGGGSLRAAGDAPPRPGRRPLHRHAQPRP